MVRFLSLLTLLVALPTAAQQPGIAGDWTGVLVVSEPQPGSDSLIVIFHVSEGEGGYTATFDIPEEGMFALPLSDVAFDGQTFSAYSQHTDARYSGVLDAENTQIDGLFTQRNITSPLVLVRYESPEGAAATEGYKPSSIKPGDYTGDWLGIIPLHTGGESYLTFHLARNDDGTYNASLDAPGQAASLNLGRIEVYGRDVVIDVMGQASYTGVVSDDEMTMDGTLEQGGEKFPMTLTRQ